MDPEFQAMLAALLQRARRSKPVSFFSPETESRVKEQVGNFITKMDEDRQQVDDRLGPNASGILDMVAGGLPGGGLLTGALGQAGRFRQASSAIERGSRTANAMRPLRVAPLAKGEEITHAATKFGDRIILGANHGTTRSASRRLLGVENPWDSGATIKAIDGFETTTGRFITREEAFQLFRPDDVDSFIRPGPGQGGSVRPKLISENVPELFRLQFPENADDPRLIARLKPRQ